MRIFHLKSKNIEEIKIQVKLEPKVDIEIHVKNESILKIKADVESEEKTKTKLELLDSLIEIKNEAEVGKHIKLEKQNETSNISAHSLLKSEEEQVDENLSTDLEEMDVFSCNIDRCKRMFLYSESLKRHKIVDHRNAKNNCKSSFATRNCKYRLAKQ